MLIGKGAEAEVYLEHDKVRKVRIKKNYRIKKIDLRLRKTRTKREAKILEKLPKEIPSPDLIHIDDKNMEIMMSHVKGKKVRDILDDNIDLCKEIGEEIAIIHNSGIIHGDLTTSNMIYNKKVYFIDFGLSYFSQKIEDKAVDLHLIKQALESKHYKIYQKAFSLILEGYKTKSKNYDTVIKRLEKVESRGRNKKK